MFLFHSLNGFVGASSLYGILSSISKAHDTGWAYLVFETLKPDKKDPATPPSAISDFVIVATQSLQSNQSFNALKCAMSMWSPLKIIRIVLVTAIEYAWQLHTLVDAAQQQ